MKLGMSLSGEPIVYDCRNLAVECPFIYKLCTTACLAFLWDRYLDDAVTVSCMRLGLDYDLEKWPDSILLWAMGVRQPGRMFKEASHVTVE